MILQSTDIKAALRARKRQRGFFTMPGGLAAGPAGGGGGADPNASSIMASMVAWWEFNENDSDTQFRDSFSVNNLNILKDGAASASSANSSVINGLTVSGRHYAIPAYGVGAVHNHAYLPYSNQYAGWLPNSDWSLFGWTRGSNTTAGGTRFIVCRYYSGDSDSQFYLLIPTSGLGASFGVYDSSGSAVAIAGPAELPTATNTYFVALIFDRTNNLIRFRVKGPKAGSGGTAVDFNQTAAFPNPIKSGAGIPNFTFGEMFKNNNTYLDGFRRMYEDSGGYEEWGLCHKALTNDDFDYLYNSGNGVSYETVKADAQENNVRMLLLLNESNGATSIADSSIYAQAVTPAGGAAVSDTYTGGGRPMLSGGTWTTVYKNNMLLGDKDFTLRGWMVTRAGTLPTFLFIPTNSFPYYSLILNCQAANKLYMRIRFDGGSWAIDQGESTTSMTVGAVRFVSLTRQGSNFYLHIDGVLKSSATHSGSIDTGVPGNDMRVVLAQGGGNAADVGAFEFRVGEALYGASNYTPPTAASELNTDTVVDADWSNVSCLMNFDKTVITDDGPVKQSFTVTGTAARSTAQSKFGGASLLPGATGNIRCASSSYFQMGSGKFTVDAHIYLTGSVASAICSLWASGNLSWYFGLDGSRNLLVFSSLDGSTGDFSAVSSVTVPTGQQCHVVLQRGLPGVALATDDNWHFFLDGVYGGSIGMSGTLFNSSAGFCIGSHDSAAGYFSAGYIDAVRVTKGVARYGTSGFTPPTVPYPRNV